MKKIKDILSFCRVKPVMHQTELHPYNQMWELKEFCEANGIFMTAYFPLGGALLMNSEDSLMKNQVLLEIAGRYNKTAPQIMIRWCIQRGVVCIPKSVHMNRIEENCQVFDFELTEEEMKMIRDLNKYKFFSYPTFLLSSEDKEDYFDNELAYGCLFLRTGHLVFNSLFQIIVCHASS